MLSKSRYTAGLQCPKRLWYEVNAREQLAPPDAATQAIFDQGTEIGRTAQGLFPDGVEIDRKQLAWASAVTVTEEALARRVPLYEAAFAHLGAGCRVDILVPVERGDAWDLVEIKCTSEVKEDHLEDVAFQTWVVRGAGVPLRRSVLGHLDTGYVRSGALDLQRLFALEDVTERIAPVLPRMPAEVRRLQAVAAQAAHPEVAIGPHCAAPYNCPLERVCWTEVPEGSVLDLSRGGAKSWRLWNDGVVDLTSIPAGTRLTDRQQVQVTVARSGQAHVDRQALRRFLDRLEYPVQYLDFESCALAIPPFDGTRPFQQIPFQFSLQVVESPGAAVRTIAFLAEGAADPRPAFVAALREAIGSVGSIVVYNQTFELGRIRELARDLPDEASQLSCLLPRIVDLLEPFRNFAYLHPAQSGSASIKAVLPVLVGRGYEELEIQEGDSASRAYLRLVDPAIPRDERAAIRSALLAYCGRDTEGMVEIAQALERLAAPLE
jgi:hypothetical protein